MNSRLPSEFSITKPVLGRAAQQSNRPLAERATARDDHPPPTEYTAMTQRWPWVRFGLPSAPRVAGLTFSRTGEFNGLGRGPKRAGATVALGAVWQVKNYLPSFER